MDKNMKRAKRRHQMFRVMKKRLMKIKETCEEYYEEIIKRHREGHFRKSTTYDCGNPRCYLCHFDKLTGKRPVKEQNIRDKYDREIKNTRSDWEIARLHNRYSNLNISMGL